MILPKRKSPRLPGYDYSQNGSYFITICTKGKELFFGSVGADSISARMIARTFMETIQKFPQVQAPVYKVMPNHFHAIVTIDRADMESAPTLHRIIQEFKRYSTVEYIKLVHAGVAPVFDKQLWQRSFHERIIRSQREYEKIWSYIQYNDQKWEADCFYPGSCNSQAQGGSRPSPTKNS